MENLDNALRRLRQVLLTSQQSDIFQTRIHNREEVLGRFNPAFRKIDNLTLEDFQEFLYFDINKHWTGLHRQVRNLTVDMDTLRNALKHLLDESIPLARRFDDTLGKIRGLGKALATAILLVAYPEKYGVWNSISESGLKILDIWPDFERGTTLGQKYEQINEIFTYLSTELNIDFWMLDWLWWDLVEQQENADVEEPPEVVLQTQTFRLERHLHDFLADNWEQTELAHEWAIYSEDNNEMTGYEYPTGIGRIDILARHKSNGSWLVIELKRNRAADKVIGQLFRYMGWVREHLAANNEPVYGLIIASEIDNKLKYAIKGANHGDISLMLYRMHFSLERPSF